MPCIRPHPDIGGHDAASYGEGWKNVGPIRPRISIALVMDLTPHFLVEGGGKIVPVDTQAGPLLQHGPNQNDRLVLPLLGAAILADFEDKGPGTMP